MSFLLCISLFPEVKPGVCAFICKKKRDRRSEAALRSQERALLGKKGEEEEMLGGCASYKNKTRSGLQKFLKKIRIHFLFKADGGGQYRLVFAELCFGSCGRDQDVTVAAKEFMEIPQINLGEMDKEKAGGYAVELPVPVQYFSAEYHLAVVVDILDEYMNIRGQQMVGFIIRGQMGWQGCPGERFYVLPLEPSIVGYGKHGVRGNWWASGREKFALL